MVEETRFQTSRQGTGCDRAKEEEGQVIITQSVSHTCHIHGRGMVL